MLRFVRQRIGVHQQGTLSRRHHAAARRGSRFQVLVQFQFGRNVVDVMADDAGRVGFEKSGKHFVGGLDLARLVERGDAIGQVLHDGVDVMAPRAFVALRAHQRHGVLERLPNRACRRQQHPLQACGGGHFGHHRRADDDVTTALAQTAHMRPDLVERVILKMLERDFPQPLGKVQLHVGLPITEQGDAGGMLHGLGHRMHQVVVPAFHQHDRGAQVLLQKRPCRAGTHKHLDLARSLGIFGVRQALAKRHIDDADVRHGGKCHRAALHFACQPARIRLQIEVTDDDGDARRTMSHESLSS